MNHPNKTIPSKSLPNKKDRAAVSSAVRVFVSQSEATQLFLNLGFRELAANRSR